MKNLDGRTIAIGTLLSQDFFFHVPEYQRPFSWKTDHFDDLIDDVITATRGQEYFLGTMVLHYRKERGHNDVVDGQQRLTSLLILFACLRDFVKDDNFKKGLQDKILQRKNVVDGIPEKVRLEVKDRKLFGEIVVEEGGTTKSLKKSELPEPEWRYVNAVNVFRSKLAKLSEKEIQELITFLSQKCVVICLATETFDDAFRLFTIVNDRGKQLRRIDVLKALNIAPDVIASDTVRNRVAQEWEDLEKGLGESTFESIFHLIRLILLKDKPQGDLLKEFENRIFLKKTVSKGGPFFDLVFEYSKLYTAIFIERDIIPTEAPEHNRYRSLIHIMNAEFKASEWRACLLYFASRFGSKSFYEFCLGMEKVFLAQWVKAMRKDERYADYSKILALIESAKKPDDVLGGLSYDSDAIMQAAVVNDLYSVGFGKYFLLRLELVTAEHDALHEFDAKSVEHVLPRNPEAEGYWADNHDLTKIDKYVNTIGNLVLLSKSKNSSARNFDFDKKKEKYLKDRVSDYPRSIQVLSYEDWDRKTIKQRTVEAQKIILQDP
ncbi:MAG: DUF262 domain-containing HNH endonuclease family protein [bacterium]